MSFYKLKNYTPFTVISKKNYSGFRFLILSQKKKRRVEYILMFKSYLTFEDNDGKYLTSTEGLPFSCLFKKHTLVTNRSSSLVFY